MDPETIPIALEPPFTGVRLVECDGDAGGPAKVLISCPPRDREWLTGEGSKGKRLQPAKSVRRGLASGSTANVSTGSVSAQRNGPAVRPKRKP